jgi:hypothetical protein
MLVASNKFPVGLLGEQTKMIFVLFINSIFYSVNIQLVIFCQQYFFNSDIIYLGRYFIHAIGWREDENIINTRIAKKLLSADQWLHRCRYRQKYFQPEHFLSRSAFVSTVSVKDQDNGENCYSTPSQDCSHSHLKKSVHRLQNSDRAEE